MEAWTEEVAGLARVIGGDRVRLREEFGLATMTVPASWWRSTLIALRDQAHLTYFDWLSVVDEAGAPAPEGDDAVAGGFRVVCHLVGLSPGVKRTHLRHLLVEAWLPRSAASIDSLVTVYAGAAWHEREAYEMFGVAFDDETTRVPLLLPDGFEGHPLRKEFVLASRVVKPWPGAKEPGESDHDAAPSRRRTRPPGVPEPEQWGPREPGSTAPDPLAYATAPSSKPARPRRTRRADAPSADRPSTDAPPRPGGEQDG